ncbi:hypothetical protein niasHT_009247 [Heterodera trifolii]|uniref:ISXO2-like transposase domain-containing protein n=1 Tax=Heterodera trifolii TaxID=157864 RepID=A0ABD2MD73_9BILA
MASKCSPLKGNKGWDAFSRSRIFGCSVALNASNWERVFLVPVESRSANRLIPLQQYILPGTTIVSDEWRSYRGIPNLPQSYTHLTVTILKTLSILQTRVR